MLQLSPTLKKTLSNLTWLSADRILRLGGGILVNAWLTRYLGTELNGILSFSLAFVGMFAPLATLGLDSIVVRDIVRNVSRRDEILGSAFHLRMLGAIAALALSTAAIFTIRPSDNYTHILVVITGFGLLFQSFDVIDFWFQSQVQSKYTVYAKNTAFFLLNICKIITIIFQGNIVIFVVLSALEIFIGSVGLILMYARQGFSIFHWKPKLKTAVQLLTNSWPLIISDFALFIQARIDQVMLGELLGKKELGVYAAAVKAAEPLAFIPMIILTSVYPTIVKSKEWSEDVFYSRMINLYRLMFIITVVTCLPISLLSYQIIYILYGKEFIAAAIPLSFLIWSRIYSNFGVARTIFISAENMFTHSLLCAVTGSVASIVSNLFFIPKFGVLGAILSANIGYIITIFFWDAVFPKTRRNFKSMALGIFTFYKFSRKWDAEHS